MDPSERDLGVRIARHRRARGLTQVELAEKIGVAPETISRIERGTVVPSIARAGDIARAVGVELATLFRRRQGPADAVIDELLNVMARRDVDDVRFAAQVAAQILRHIS